MAKVSRLAGSTGHILEIFIQDSSKSTGDGLAGLAYNTAGLTCYYKRNTGTASVAVTLVSLTTLGTYTSGGFAAVDAANMPGAFEFHPPDAAYAAGAKTVVFMLRGAANMAPVLIEVELTQVDNQDAQRYGMAALPATGTLAVSPTLAATQAFNNTGQTSNIPTDLQTIKGQAVTAAAGVTFPAAIGTSTYAGADTPGTTSLLATIGVAGAGLTALGDARLANLDAAVSTRSTYAGGAVASVTAPVTVNAINGVAPPSNWNLLSIDASGRVLLQPSQGFNNTGQTSNLPVDLQTIKGQSVTAAAGVTFPAVVSGYAGGAVASVTAPVTVGTNQDKAGYSLAVAPPTAAQVATAVLTDTTTGDLTVAGSLGSLVGTAPAWYAAPPVPPTAAAIATAVLTDAASADLAQAGSLGHLVTTAPAWYVAPDNADVAAVKATIGVAGAGLTALGDTRLANLDAAVSTRSTYAGGAVASVTAPVTVGTVQDKAGYALAPAGLDPVAVEAGLNARQALALAAAGDAGQVTYASGGTTVTITGAGVSTPRITATVDASGNRVPTIHPPA